MSKFFAIIVFACAIFFAGCPNASLLPEPTQKVVEEAVKMPIPTNLTATQGKYREIELAWEPAGNAVRYYVYAAASQFDEFVQVGETVSNETIFAKNEASGFLSYYRVTAVDRYGKESAASNMVRATTLASPVIIDITSEEDKPVSVSWYMNNCTYYEDDSVVYTVICYGPDGATEVARHTLASKTANTVLFEGLEPHTNYFFEVEVYNTADQEKVEKSQKMDAETARRTKPNPPNNLAVAKGEHSDYIRISFEKPKMVDVEIGTNQFEQTALDFKVFRKEKGTDEYIDVTERVSVQSGNLAHTGNLEDYSEGAEVVLHDESIRAHRGRQYVYKVQSYAYKEKESERYKDYGSVTAATAEGWTVPAMSYAMHRQYSPKNSEGRYESVTLSGKLEFEAHGMDDNYRYDLSYDFYKQNAAGIFESDPTDKDKLINSDMHRSELENYELHLALPEHNGVYHFIVRAKHVSSGWSDEVRAKKSEHVSDSTIYEIENLNVIDGYPDKFVISWTIEDNVEYILSHKKAGATAFTEHRRVKKESDDDDYVCEFPAAPGDEYQFRVIAIGGKSEETEMCYTLGKPDVTFDESSLSMDSITVSWNEIKKATEYKVAYEYEGGNGHTVEGTEFRVKDGALTHTFEKPAGYDLMQHSGKDVKVTVTAINADDELVTANRGKAVSIDGETTARTLGPALTMPRASLAEKPGEIEFSWEKISGATGYYISRTRFEFGNKNRNAENLEAIYYYDVAQKKLLVSSISIEETAQYASVAEKIDGGGHTYLVLTDKYTNEGTGNYYAEQSKLAWGYPFRYQVFPVMDDDGNSFERNTQKFAEFTAKDVTYKDADGSYATGAALGYGRNVKATKGVEMTATGDEYISKTVRVTWEDPTLADGTNHSYTIYRKREGTADWEPVGNASDVYDDASAAKGVVYEYAVGVTVNRKTANPTTNNVFLKYCDENNIDENWQGEKASAGFVLPQPTIAKVSRDSRSGATSDSDNANQFVEQIDWTAVNVGQDNDKPLMNRMFDGYAIEVLNPNIDGNWHVMYMLRFGENISPTEKMLRTEGRFSTNAANKDGLLKVLRDYHHYFRIRAFTEVGDKITYSEPTDWALGDADTNYVKWGARQISAEELVRASMLIMAYGADNAAKKRTLGNWSAAAGEGTFEAPSPGSGNTKVNSFKNRSSFLGIPTGDVYHKIQYNDFKPAMKTKAGTDVTFLTISATNGAEFYGETNSGTGLSTGKEYHTLGWDQKGDYSITIKGPSDVEKLYNAKFKVYWLQPAKEPVGNKGIHITYPEGGTEEVFGNITPFSFDGGAWTYDTDEWK